MLIKSDVFFVPKMAIELPMLRILLAAIDQKWDSKVAAAVDDEIFNFM